MDVVLIDFKLWFSCINTSESAVSNVTGVED